MDTLQPLLGIAVFLSIPFLLSRARQRVSFKLVLTGVLAQFLLALLLLKVPLVVAVLFKINGIVGELQSVTDRSTQFMFGYLAGGATPFELVNPANNFIVAVRVLPLILVVSAISALLFHFGILTFIVQLFAKLLRRFFGVSGALGFGSASTLFLGTVEAPLIIRPYLGKLSSGELLALITCSMATISGTVMILYGSVLEKILPNALTHMLTASVISIPAALTLSHIFLPWQQVAGDAWIPEKSHKSWIETLLQSIQDGFSMVISIVGIIVVMMALVYLLDDALGTLYEGLSFSALLSLVLKPFMWLIGLDWDKAGSAAELMGVKIVLNEFVAFLQLSGSTEFQPKEILTLVYSMCGFANIGSCGILIAGLSAIVPERREEIVRFSFVSLLLGNLATLMTGAVIHLLG